MKGRLFEAFDCDAVQLSTSESSVDTDKSPAAIVSVCPVRLVLQEQHSEANFGRDGWALIQQRTDTYARKETPAACAIATANKKVRSLVVRVED